MFESLTKSWKWLAKCLVKSPKKNTSVLWLYRENSNIGQSPLSMSLSVDLYIVNTRDKPCHPITDDGCLQSYNSVGLFSYQSQIEWLTPRQLSSERWDIMAIRDSVVTFLGTFCLGPVIRLFSIIDTGQVWYWNIVISDRTLQRDTGSSRLMMKELKDKFVM